MDGINAGRATMRFAGFRTRSAARRVWKASLAYRVEWDEYARAFKKTPRAQLGLAPARTRGITCRSRGARRCASRSRRRCRSALPLPDLTMDQFMDIEDGWSMREDSV